MLQNLIYLRDNCLDSMRVTLRAADQRRTIQQYSNQLVPTTIEGLGLGLNPKPSNLAVIPNFCSVGHKTAEKFTTSGPKKGTER